MNGFMDVYRPTRILSHLKAIFNKQHYCEQQQSARTIREPFVDMRNGIRFFKFRKIGDMG